MASQANVIEYSDSSPDIMVPLLREDFPEIVRVTRGYKYSSEKIVLQYGEKNFYQSGIYVDSEFLQIFTFPLIAGNSKSALNDPGSMVISETVAQKLFGSENPIGKTVTYREKYKKYDVQITGVLKDIPQNSHLQFDFLLPFKTLSSDKRNSYMFNTWDVANFTTYVETRTPEAKGTIEEKFPSFIARHREISEEEAKKSVQAVLQPLNDIHLRSRIRGNLASNYEIKYVYLYSSIAFIILLIACVNYMNLTTARSITRAREIGIRKVVGVNRKQLIIQFIGESMLTAVMAAGIALLLVKYLLPRFNTLIGTDLQINYAENVSLLLLILGTTILEGLASGSYPAFVLSAFHPSHILKDQTASGKRGVKLRNALVVVQFSASIVLIISTIIIYA